MQIRFEPTIPVFVGEKRVHGLDRAATVFGSRISGNINITKFATAAKYLHLLAASVHFHFPVNISKTKKKSKTKNSRYICVYIYR
jgi:hypothetical protein